MKIIIIYKFAYISSGNLPNITNKLSKSFHNKLVDKPVDTHNYMTNLRVFLQYPCDPVTLNSPPKFSLKFKTSKYIYN